MILVAFSGATFGVFPKWTEAERAEARAMQATLKEAPVGTFIVWDKAEDGVSLVYCTAHHKLFLRSPLDGGPGHELYFEPIGRHLLAIERVVLPDSEEYPSTCVTYAKQVMPVSSR
ncbi:MAG: hypothetical protein COV10_03735 [Candidatus Vogelbacteria bacterium CG10_big_fil_rev_8_21_14_0_10_51_16]|uniref:Uncharacterized protein n=1 Tax=Candidatus Vogelbacteria bacterium CG10_big_fil_rev_8_21_14_0_10_51_16 TaxID=1975045 RepID=A0A2H0RDN0_9BACT|nr:MAG: hypothetical protein COV10_03735 [Candidatus Vogelbacteria bacterium CG10_big_fil_rev_8_21_14_0_10_51_16]